MEEPLASPGLKMEKPKKDSKGVLALLLGIIAVLALAAAGWFWWQWSESQKSNTALNSEKAALQAQVDQLKKASVAEEADAAPCTVGTVSAAKKENIKAALDTKNTEPFKTYTTDPVKYTLAASEYSKNVTPDEAAKNIEYTHSATGPWNFDLPKATTDAYLAGDYKTYFTEKTLFGKAASGMVVAFNFDCNDKITQIFVSAVDLL